jgi:fucose 4-O-acetylase-like acetyltransferase
MVMLSQLSERLSEWLEPIAAWFRSLGVPEPIVHWGHPLMMGIVVVVMGSFAAYTGWRGRLLTATDDVAAAKSRGEHKSIASLMFLFIALGYTGGILSLVMQQQPILQSPHFWTGTVAIALLSINALIAAFGFSQGKGFRTMHAYLGSATLVLLLIHGALGLKLGLSI